MSPRAVNSLKPAFFLLVVVSAVFFGLNRCCDTPCPSRRNVYIAFGFHGNLYHSFRNDTADEFGFGKDIRVIRHILQTLDRFNAQGVPVKAVWDFDNLFSLQEILPRHAPDIIDDLKRRVRAQGDEMILMSYNNGLASAMTRRELTQSMQWAVTNPWLSGVQDLFGRYSPIVRPQEMMTTPGVFDLYQQLGVRAAALYYSATPFDAFRVFSRPLTLAEAHNPILYRNPQTGEQMTIIPSYHIGDLVENVSLRRWVKKLHALQQNGTLTRDALLFINFDADSEFWSGIDLPWPLSGLPNTGGIEALIHEVRDLPFVRFTTLNDYLDNHPPAGVFHFSQDTADGSFNGYNSWAEKAPSSLYWTAIQRSRRVESAALKTVSLLNHPDNLSDLKGLLETAEQLRLRALATTHFGMATPFVARQREQAVAQLLNRLNRRTDEILGRIQQALGQHMRASPPERKLIDGLLYAQTLVLLHPLDADGDSGGRFFTVRPPDKATGRDRFCLRTPAGEWIETINCGPVESEPDAEPGVKLYVPPGPAPMTDGLYHLYRRPAAPDGADNPASNVHQGLFNHRLELRIDTTGQVQGIHVDGGRRTDAGGFLPYIRYGDDVIEAHSLTWRREPCGSLSVSGYLTPPLEHNQAAGGMDYTFSLVGEAPYLRLRGRIRYPTTLCRDVFKTGAPGLMRHTDMRWREVAPAEIRLTPSATRQTPVTVLKHNFLGVGSRYAIDYFKHDSRNLNTDNANNHITDAYVGVVAGGYGAAVAMDNSVLANFAFAPLKVSHDSDKDRFKVRINPFGAYHGRQYRPPTWGNGIGYALTHYAGEHLFSAAPTYNGGEQTFDLLIAFFEGDQIPPKIQRDLTAFAHPLMVIDLGAIPRSTVKPGPPPQPAGFTAAYYNGAVQFNWDTGGQADGHYRIECGTRPGYYEKVFAATGFSLKIDDFLKTPVFSGKQKFYARIQAVSGDGRASSPSREIRFETRPADLFKPPAIPWSLKLKIMWTYIRAWTGDCL